MKFVEVLSLGTKRSVVFCGRSATLVGEEEASTMLSIMHALDLSLI